MDLGIRGRAAMVCGGSSGLGKAIAKALANDGAYAAFVCSDLAGYVTGQNLMLDGGQFPGLV